MSIYLDPTGQSTFGLAICDRCHFKFYTGDLRPDPNSPGLMVCCDCIDQLDPYRLPAPATDDLTLPFVRPDVPLIVTED